MTGMERGTVRLNWRKILFLVLCAELLLLYWNSLNRTDTVRQPERPGQKTERPVSSVTVPHQNKQSTKNDPLGG
jgi:hypothetical protein